MIHLQYLQIEDIEIEILANFAYLVNQYKQKDQCLLATRSQYYFRKKKKSSHALNYKLFFQFVSAPRLLSDKR